MSVTVKIKGTLARLGIVQKLRKATTLKPADWFELAVAAEALFEARIIFAQQPVKSLIERLQAREALLGDSETPNVEFGPRNHALDDQIARLGWAISVAAQALPWRADCLIRCIAADKILRRRNLEPNFYLGVTKHPDGRFNAHAWLRCQGISVTGGEGKEFEVLIGPDKRES